MSPVSILVLRAGLRWNTQGVARCVTVVVDVRVTVGVEVRNEQCAITCVSK